MSSWKRQKGRRGTHLRLSLRTTWPPMMPLNDTAWNNKEFDAIVAKARSTPDDSERAQLYAEAQKLILRDTPYIIPFFQDVLTASRDGVKGWVVHPLNRVYYIESVWLDRN